MNTNTLTIGAVLLIVGLGLGYLIWGTPSGVNTGQHIMPGGGMMSQNIDQHFIVQMIPHHEGAIEMARVALERSKRPEIISLAQGIIESQQKEINDMTSWYRAWFDSDVPTEGMGMPVRQSLGVGGMHGGGMSGDVAVLEKLSGPAFDREFLQQMIPHHEMAIMMVQMLAAGTERAEMKQLADNIRTSQSREIVMMRGWLESWYGE